MSERQTVSLSMRELMPLVIEQLESGQNVTLTVKGVSMQPFLMDGKDAIVMTKIGDRKPIVGDLYMFRRPDGSYAMHRVYSVNPNGSLDFVGDNQFLLERVEQSALVAYVKEVVRGGKTINCEKGYWRRKMTRRMLFRQRHKELVLRIPTIKWYVTAPLKHPVKAVKWAGRRLGGKKNEQSKKALEKTEK